MAANGSPQAASGDRHGTVVGMIQELRDTTGVPVNVVESDEPVVVTWHVAGQDPVVALETLAAHTNAYRWRRVLGRYVVYPTAPEWESEIARIRIVQVPRNEAALQYVAEVRSQLAALGDLVAGLIKGDPRSPVYTEPVTLSPRAPILQHLVELLGSNSQLAFTIERAKSGARLLHFEQVALTRT